LAASRQTKNEPKVAKMYEMKEKRTRNFQASHFYANFYVDLIFESGLILGRGLIFFNPRSKGPYFFQPPLKGALFFSTPAQRGLILETGPILEKIR
jgi:hypothetical protein